MKLRLVSTKPGSASLKRLAVELSSRLKYKVFRGTFPKINRKNIVYGTQDCCKIKQYQFFAQNNINSLVFSTSQTEAQNWTNEGCVFARTITTGSEGKGIIVIEKGGQVPMAKVYTQYKKKKREYRVHIYNDTVIQVLEKRKRKGWENERETKIRNLANGYVFCSNDVVEPEGLRELALKASKVSSSCFKGVDIGYNEKNNELFVIEVNSRPGIQGTNVQRYCDAILAN